MGIPRDSWAGVITAFGRPVGGTGCAGVTAEKTASALGTPVVEASLMEDCVIVGVGAMGYVWLSSDFPQADKTSAAAQRLYRLRWCFISILFGSPHKLRLMLIEICDHQAPVGSTIYRPSYALMSVL